jgi:hypothetical protein
MDLESFWRRAWPFFLPIGLAGSGLLVCNYPPFRSAGLCALEALGNGADRVPLLASWIDTHVGLPYGSLLALVIVIILFVWFVFRYGRYALKTCAALGMLYTLLILAWVCHMWGAPTFRAVAPHLINIFNTALPSVITAVRFLAQSVPHKAVAAMSAAALGGLFYRITESKPASLAMMLMSFILCLAEPAFATYDHLSKQESIIEFLVYISTMFVSGVSLLRELSDSHRRWAGVRQ